MAENYELVRKLEFARGKIAAVSFKLYFASFSSCL